MLLLFFMALYFVWAEEGTAISAIGPDAANITFIIISQPGQFHSDIAETSRRSLLDQWKKIVPSLKIKPPKILLNKRWIQWQLFSVKSYCSVCSRPDLQTTRSQFSCLGSQSPSTNTET